MLTISPSLYNVPSREKFLSLFNSNPYHNYYPNCVVLHIILFELVTWSKVLFLHLCGIYVVTFRRSDSDRILLYVFATFLISSYNQISLSSGYSTLPTKRRTMKFGRDFRINFLFSGAKIFFSFSEGLVHRHYRQSSIIHYRQSVEVNARVLVRSPLIRSSLEFMFIVFSSYIKFLYIFLFI